MLPIAQLPSAMYTPVVLLLIAYAVLSILANRARSDDDRPRADRFSNWAFLVVLVFAAVRGRAADRGGCQLSEPLLRHGAHHLRDLGVLRAPPVRVLRARRSRSRALFAEAGTASVGAWAPPERPLRAAPPGCSRCRGLSCTASWARAGAWRSRSAARSSSWRRSPTIVLAPRIAESNRERKAEEQPRGEAALAARVRRLRAEQRPQRGEPRPERRARRRGRARGPDPGRRPGAGARGKLQGPPAKRVECEPLGGSRCDGARVAYDCIAVTSDLPSGESLAGRRDRPSVPRGGRLLDRAASRGAR